jgi:hypothetical protein
MTKRNSNKRSKAEKKTKSKITWGRQISDPLGMGNGSTHPRQNYAQAKSTNYQSIQELPLHICKLPLNECQLWAQTGQAGSQNRSDRLPKTVRPVAKTGQTALVQQTTPPKSQKRKRNAQAPPWLLGEVLGMECNFSPPFFLLLVANAWIKSQIWKHAT